jgi:hypothetical protein
MTCEAINNSFVQVVSVDSSQNALLTNMHRIFMEFRLYLLGQEKKKCRPVGWGMDDQFSTAAEKIRA